MGRVKSGRGTLLGNAGEYFVMAELLRRDAIAGLVPRNAPGMDILAAIGKRSLKIRVKTKSSEADSWVWMAKGEGAEEVIFVNLLTGDQDDLTALVDIPDDGPPTIHLVRTSGLDSLLKTRHREWLDRPGKGGHPHRPSKMRRLNLGPDLESLKEGHAVSWNDLQAT
jgi:hypothetical protein